MSRSRKRPFTKSRMYSTSCRSSGDCPWCRGNRLCSRHRAEEAAKDQLEEWRDNPDLDDELPEPTDCLVPEDAHD